MLALGIDPGTAICGYGLVELKGSKLKAIYYGAITTAPSMRSPERLAIIFNGIDALIKQYKPDILGVEQLFFNRNITTAIPVGQARGVILLAAAQNKLRVSEFTPLQVKQSVVGYGKATKEQVIYMTQKILNLTSKPKPDDVADALAIGICTVHTGNLNSVWEKKI